MKTNEKLKMVLTLIVIAGMAAALPQTLFAQSAVDIQPPAALVEMAKAPAPSASAGKGTDIGKGDVKLNTSDAADDTDSIWAEELDIDGDGDVEQTDLLWDDEDKILFLSAQATFTCTNGNPGDGGMLMAIYGEGNSANAPAGSGWFTVSLDASECDAQVAGLYGCMFDAQGNATSCGAVAIDDDNDVIVITASA